VAQRKALRLGTRGEVIRLIRERQGRGKPLHNAAVLEQDPQLELAARTHFGTWRAAVEATGFRLTGRQLWNKARVIAEIRSLIRRGAPLVTTRVPNQLVMAAITYFGSWRTAVASAGVDYKVVESQHQGRRSREQVMALLRTAARSGRTGIGPKGFISGTLASYVRLKFGSLPAMIEAAGLDPSKFLHNVHGRYKTAESIAVELQRLSRAQPEMSLSELYKVNSGLATAARKRYGTLMAAVAAAGISGWPRQLVPYWPPREEIVALIQERHRQGTSIQLLDVKATDRRLLNAAVDRFGTWRSAVRAAGLGYLIDNHDRVWIGNQIQAELKGRRLRGEAMDRRAIQRDDPRLWSAIVTWYGSLAKALREANATRRAAKTRALPSRRGRTRRRRDTR
jgi:hypothetical protein